MSAVPTFARHMRRATGGTLLVPSLAERVAGAGGFIAFSNVSPGAAYFLDPEHFGHVYHRAGSYAPGGEPHRGRRCARRQPRCGRRLGDDATLLRAKCWAIARPARGVPVALRSRPHVARRAARFARACRCAARRGALRGRGPAHRRAAARRGRRDPAAHRLRSRPGDDRRRRRSRRLAGSARSG